MATKEVSIVTKLFPAKRRVLMIPDNEIPIKPVEAYVKILSQIKMYGNDTFAEFGCCLGRGYMPSVMLANVGWELHKFSQDYESSSTYRDETCLPLAFTVSERYRFQTVINIRNVEIRYMPPQKIKPREAISTALPSFFIYK